MLQNQLKFKVGSRIQQVVFGFVMAMLGNAIAFGQAPDYKAFVRDLEFQFGNQFSDVQYISHSFVLQGDGPIVDWTASFYSPVVQPGNGTAAEAKAAWPEQGVNPITLGAITPPPTSTMDLGQFWRIEWHPHGGGNYSVSGTLDLSKLELKPGKLFEVVVDPEYAPGPPGAPGGGSQSIPAQFVWSKPGITLVRCPLPSAGEAVTGPITASCSSCNCGNEFSKPNNGAVQPGVAEMLGYRLYNDSNEAEIPSGCSSCGGDSPGGSSTQMMMYRQHRPDNLFWHSSFGRGFQSHYDYVLKIRNDNGRLAFLSDPVLGVVIKFGERLEGVTTGGVGGPQGVQGTGIYDPVDHKYYESFTLVDELGSPVLDPEIEAETKKVFATLKRRNGWEYKFRLIDRFNARLIEITDPVHGVTSLTYRQWSEEQIRQSPTRQMQLQTIIGPHGDSIGFEYFDDKKAGRWAIKKVYIGGNEIEYGYDANGFLSSVSRKRPGGQFYTQASYAYALESDGVNIDKMEFDGTHFATRTTVLSADYATAGLNAKDQLTSPMPWLDDDEFGGLGDPNYESELKLVNQVGNTRVGKKNSHGHYTLQVFFEQSPVEIDDNQIRLVYEDQLLEWSVGQSARYAKSMPADPSDFSQGDFEDPATYGDMFPRNIDVTADQILHNTPAKYRDKTGYITDREYDAQNNLTKVIYPDTNNTFEEHQYNAFNQPVYYRDRAGLITRTNRDTKGRVTKVIRGLKLVNGVETAQPGALQAVYKYGANNLLEWMGASKYPGPDPSTDYQTTYHYNSNRRIIKIQYPAVQTELGQLTRPEVNYQWVDDRLTSITDEEGQIRTFDYDNCGRLIRTRYISDNSTEEVKFDDPLKRIFRKTRGDVVSVDFYDTSYRHYRSETPIAQDSNILDGISGSIPTVDRHLIIKLFWNGWARPYYSRNDGNATRIYFDHRGRNRYVYQYPRVGQYQRSWNTYSFNRVNRTTTTNSQSVSGTTTFTSFHKYNAYAANSELVRTITAAKSNSYGNNEQMLNLTRQAQDNPSFMIDDAVRDLSGNPVEHIGNDGVVRRTEFDALGRLTKTHAAYGTPDVLTNTTEYDDFGRVKATITPDGIRNETDYDPAGNVIETRVVGTNSAGVQRTRYTYTLKGRSKKVVANDNSETTTVYDTCCGRRIGTRNALGNGTIANIDTAGRVVHTAVVGQFDTQITKKLNPDTQHTYSEDTTRYRPDGRVGFRTHWAEDPGAISVNNPPIAGLNGVDISKGVTTQYVYDDKLYDGIGLDAATGGQSITPLHSGTANNINIKAALNKLEEAESNGGAECRFVLGQDGSASVTISPDEKTMNVSITDGVGRTVMTAFMTGPAASNPNQLIDWKCRRYGLAYSLPGYGYSAMDKSIDRDGNTVSSVRNGLGHNLALIDQLGNSSNVVYNPSGAPKQQTNALGNSTTSEFDIHGRTIKVTDPLGNFTQTTYDVGGRVKTTTDAKGAVTTNNYDGLGRLISIVDRMGQTTTHSYDSMNRMDSITDAEGKTTTYDFNSLGQRTKLTLADQSETTYQYDPSGRQTLVTAPSGKNRSFVYEFGGVLEKIEYRNSTGGPVLMTEDFSYDSYLRRTGTNSSAYGVQTGRSYNANGRLASESTTISGVTYNVGYTYDDRGRTTEIVYPSGKKAEYTFTDRGEIDLIKWDGQQIENRGYDSLGQLVSVDRNHNDETRTYDANGRVLTISNTGAPGATYTYDANGNKLSETWTGVLAPYSFTTTNSGAYPTGYDSENRFRAFVQSGQNEDYRIDRNSIGVVTNRKLNNADQLRNHSNTWETTAVGPDAQVYDQDGQLTTHWSGMTLAWDQAGRMNQATVPQGSQVGIEGSHSYGYDAQGRRAWKQVNPASGNAEHLVYVYAGANPIAVYDAGTAANAPNQERVTAQTIDSWVMLDNGSQKLNVLRSQQWSVAALADANDGALVEAYEYDVFGKRNQLIASNAEFDLGFVSRFHDTETELLEVRSRVFDVSTGEFLSEDLMEYIDGASTYVGYFLGNGVDPWGLCQEEQEECLNINNIRTSKNLVIVLTFSKMGKELIDLGPVDGLNLGNVDIDTMDDVDTDLFEKIVKKLGSKSDKKILKLLKRAFKGKKNVDGSIVLLDQIQVGFMYEVKYDLEGRIGKSKVQLSRRITSEQDRWKYATRLYGGLIDGGAINVAAYDKESNSFTEWPRVLKAAKAGIRDMLSRNIDEDLEVRTIIWKHLMDYPPVYKKRFQLYDASKCIDFNYEKGESVRIGGQKTDNRGRTNVPDGFGPRR